MKSTIYVMLVLGFLAGCSPKPQPATTETHPNHTADSTAIAATVHGFYKWYDGHIHDRANDVVFTDVVKGHYALNKAKLDQYLAGILAGGFMSAGFAAAERTYYEGCEKLWQTEEAEGPPAGMDADRYFCAQDWDIALWTSGPLRIGSITDTQASVSLTGVEAGTAHEQAIELVKENGKWLIAAIRCKE